MALYADAIPKLVDVGMEIPVTFIHEKLRIPEKEKDEAVLQRAAPAQPVGLSALKAGATKFTKDQQAIEDLAESIRFKSPVDKKLIESAIRSATSPEDLVERLAVVLKDVDLSEFSEVLEKSLFAADVMGFAHAAD